MISFLNKIQGYFYNNMKKYTIQEFYDKIVK